MTLECVLFKNNKEVDWYDPIDDESDVKEINNYLVIEHSNGYTYNIEKSKYDYFVIRELIEKGR